MKTNTAKHLLAEASAVNILRDLNRRSSHKRYLALSNSENGSIELQLAVARIGVSDPDISIRSDGAMLIAQFGSSIDCFRITQLLADKDWMVRSSAVEAVNRVFGKKAEPILIRMLGDQHYIVRRDAAVALGEAGSASSIKILKDRLLTEKHDQAMLGIFEALFALGEREYLRQLVSLIESEHPGLRVAVWNGVIELAELGPFTAEELDIVENAIRKTRSIDRNPSVNQVLDELSVRLDELAD